MTNVIMANKRILRRVEVSGREILGKLGYQNERRLKSIEVIDAHYFENLDALFLNFTSKFPQDGLLAHQGIQEKVSSQILIQKVTNSKKER